MEVDGLYFAKRKPQRCPACGSDRVARIIYGMPSPEMRESPDCGVKYVMGGCCVSDVDPSWQCTSCEESIFPESARAVLEAMEPPC